MPWYILKANDSGYEESKEMLIGSLSRVLRLNRESAEYLWNNMPFTILISQYDSIRLMCDGWEAETTTQPPLP